MFFCLLVGSCSDGEDRRMQHKTAWKAGLISCPLCVAGAKGRAVPRGHFSAAGHDGGRRCMGSLFRRKSGPIGSVPSILPGGDWSKWYPALVEFLSRSVWENGESRRTGTLQISVEEDKWKAKVHDRDSSESMWVSADTPTTLLEAVEGHLSVGSGDWRRDTWTPGKRR